MDTFAYLFMFVVGLGTGCLVMTIAWILDQRDTKRRIERNRKVPSHVIHQIREGSIVPQLTREMLTEVERTREQYQKLFQKKPEEIVPLIAEQITAIEETQAQCLNIYLGHNELPLTKKKEPSAMEKLEKCWARDFQPESPVIERERLLLAAAVELAREEK